MVRADSAAVFAVGSKAYARKQDVQAARDRRTPKRLFVGSNNRNRLHVQDTGYRIVAPALRRHTL